MHTKLTILILFLSFVLRVFMLSSSPPAPYWEEVALGYDAYSILKTGKDHHGNSFPIVAFESFGDYKPALYFYAIIPFLPIFGLSVWAVRMPSVIAGVAIVYFSGKIARFLFAKPESKKKQSLWQTFTQPDILTMLVTAISPWALQFSRGGWEVNLATAFLTAGAYFGLMGGMYAFQKKPQRVVLLKYALCTLLFVASAYTYHALRVIAPLLGVCLAIPLLKQYRHYVGSIAIVGVMGLILMLPILISIKDPKIAHRLTQTSAFTTNTEVIQSNEYIAAFNSHPVAKLIFHRYWFYAKTILINAFSHFRLDFLFLTGDQNPRHSTGYFGLFFPTDILVLAVGMLVLTSNWKRKYHVLWIWLVIGLLPASLTQPTPHALRILPILPVYMVLLGLGFSSLFTVLQRFALAKVTMAVVLLVMVGQIVMYWHYYLMVYPKLQATHWQYGYQQMVESINQLKQEGEAIYITREEGRPAMYYWFFSQTEPKDVQREEQRATKDQGEFLTFQNITFATTFSGGETGLIAASPKQREQFEHTEDLAVINNQKGEPVWIIFRR